MLESRKSLSIQSVVRKVGRPVLIVIFVLLVFVLLIVGVLLVASPGKPLPIVDESGDLLAGSISEKIRININGVEQGMFIKSTDANHPVLLYLHGGMPLYFLTQKYPTGLEDHFTIVWWDRRGSGLSYSADLPQDTISVEQFISDTLAVTNYLRQRFGKEKIYLMGHSGGTFLGVQVAARAPELYHAYIAVAQMSNQLQSEKLAYDYMLKQFEADGNRKMVQKLEAAPVTLASSPPAAYLAVRDDGMHRLGIGTTNDMKSVFTGIFLPSLTNREYTLGEKVNLWRAKISSGVSLLWDEIIVTDLSVQVTELDVPVYFFHGIYDYTCSYPLAKGYFDKLKAPVKGFYTFEQSAHSPMFEEPQKTRMIFQEDILAGATDLADPQ